TSCVIVCIWFFRGVQAYGANRIMQQLKAANPGHKPDSIHKPKGRFYEMKTTKKGMLMLLALIFTMSFVLAACGGNNQSTSGNTNSNSSNSGSNNGSGNSNASDDGGNAAADLEFVELTFTYPGTKQKDHDVIMAEINSYLKEKINASIDIQPIE